MLIARRLSGINYALRSCDDDNPFFLSFFLRAYRLAVILRAFCQERDVIGREAADR